MFTLFNKNEIQYILKSHRDVDQRYDGMPYSVHLLSVANFIKKYAYILPVELVEQIDNLIEKLTIAGFGHDLIEDTNETYNDVVKVLGVFIADIIYRVTNLRGKNRDERANDEYYDGIKECPFALYVKLCDRICNMHYSFIKGSSMYKKYQSEMPHFKELLYNGLYDELWDILENIEELGYPDSGYPTVTTFDKDTIYYIRLPKLITSEHYNELFSKGIIRKKDLKVGYYYFGKCRNASVAVWNGFCFVHMREKYGSSFTENIRHLEDENGGFDVFIPLYEAIPTETQTVIYK